MVKLVSNATTLFLISLAALTQAQKQSGSQSHAECSKDVTGTGQGDLDVIKTCKTFTGNILMEKSPVGQLTLEGVEEMTGDLIIKSSDALHTFSAPNLKKVGGQLSIIDNTQLEKLDMPSLTEVKNLTLSVLPVLDQIQFPAGLSKVEDMRIEDVKAASIEGLQMESLNSFTLAQNNYMKKFDFPAKELKGKLYVAGNGHEMNFEAKQLVSIQSATFRDLGEINLPALAHVTSDISFHQNGFSKLELDSIEDIGGTLAIENNDHLSETSFKALNLIHGALSVGNNTALTTLGGYPKLGAVHGTVDLAGSFDSYDFPVLQDIRGGMRVQTTSNQFPCPEVEKKLKMTSVVKGNVWSCKSGMDASKMEPTIGQGSGGDGSAPSMDKSGKPSSNSKSGQANSAAAGLSGSLSLVLAGIVLALGF